MSAPSRQAAGVRGSGLDTAALYRERRARWLRRVLPYWRDVLRSGAGMLAALALLTAGPAYTWALDRLPADFPYRWITVPVLALSIGWSPVRTYLERADRVFLLPAEPAMAAYLRRAVRSAAVKQALITAAALTLLWPLYLRAAGPDRLAYAAALVAALAAKAAALAAGIGQPRLTSPALGRTAAALRWALAAAASFALWRFGLAAALGAAVALGAVAVALFAAGRKLPLPWERLIGLEQRHAARHFHFLSWFTDVPELAGAVKRRAVLAGLADRLPFRPGSAPLYLFAKTYLRREPFAMSLRVTVVFALLMLLFRSAPAQLACFILALLLSGLQAASLPRYHRYSSWLYLYPLAPGAASAAAGRIAAAALTVQALVLALVLAAGGVAWPLAAACFCGGAAFAAALGLVQSRKRRRDDFYAA
ncbi:ABC transporter permease [Gorillibacterium sp. sgz500922]|uniref:ABC transporter permease n=1 Tax=Gorillibacterium sp. sgz500922 TaxID=3446694 RepID=UPI003F676D30